MKEKYLVKIDGVILTADDTDQVPHEEFLDEFLEWLESKGYGFTGFSVQVDEDGNHIDSQKSTPLQ